MENKIINIVNQYSPQNNVDKSYINCSWEELGIDSINFIKLIIEIENSFDIVFEIDYIIPEMLPNMKSLIEYVIKRLN